MSNSTEVVAPPGTGTRPVLTVASIEMGWDVGRRRRGEHAGPIGVVQGPGCCAGRGPGVPGHHQPAGGRVRPGGQQRPAPGPRLPPGPGPRPRSALEHPFLLAGRIGGHGHARGPSPRLRRHPTGPGRLVGRKLPADPPALRRDRTVQRPDHGGRVRGPVDVIERVEGSSSAPPLRLPVPGGPGHNRSVRPGPGGGRRTTAPAAAIATGTKSGPISPFWSSTRRPTGPTNPGSPPSRRPRWPNAWAAGRRR